MPIAINYDREHDCLIVTVVGTVKRGDIIASRNQMIDHPEYRENLDKIVDCSHGRLDLEKADVDSISKHFFGSAEKMGDKRRTAFVAPADADYGRIRQFEFIHGSNPGMEIATFRSFPEAVDWICS